MVERTKLALVDGFNTLITRIPFEEITVQGICDEAQVSKATFYRYFKDKYDVMNYNYKQLLDESLNMESITNYRDLYYRLYSMGESRLRAIKGAFRSAGANSFEQYIYEYSRDAVIKLTEKYRGKAGITEVERMQLDVFCYGISYMYKRWISGEYDISPDAAADALYAMMPESLRGSL